MSLCCIYGLELLTLAQGGYEMKPFYGIDLTNNKRNDVANGERFLVAEPSTVMAQTLEGSTEKAVETFEQTKLPLALRVCQWICGAVGLVVVLGILKGLGKNGDLSLAQAYQNAPWLFWLGGLCLVAWAILKIVSNKRAKTVLESDEGAQAISQLETICDSVYRELSVPEDAQDVDVLSFFYKEKDGGIKVCEKPMQTYSHVNCEFKMFADSENLYLAHLGGKFAFPLSSLQAIRTEDKKVRAFGWNKDEEPNQGTYKQYKLTTDQYGCIHSKPYYILELQYDSEIWGIYFPCYELPVFEKITGLRVQ